MSVGCGLPPGRHAVVRWGRESHSHCILSCTELVHCPLKPCRLALGLIYCPSWSQTFDWGKTARPGWLREDLNMTQHMLIASYWKPVPVSGVVRHADSGCHWRYAVPSGSPRNYFKRWPEILPYGSPHHDNRSPGWSKMSWSSVMLSV